MTVEPLRYGGWSRRSGEAAAGCTTASAAAGPRLVLLHGWCCNAGVWQVLRAVWLRQCAAPPPIAITLSPLLGDIDRMCRDLSRQLAPLLARREPLVLVAHSMGGLVARRWLQQDAAAARLVLGLLTVGTPHAGTRLARLGPGRAAAQMRPGSDWLAALAAARPSCPVSCVWSETDGFVAPAGSAVLAHAASVALQGRGHFGMLRDARLPPLVADWLKRCTSPTVMPQPAPVS
jgi:triacylglycerol lipase